MALTSQRASRLPSWFSTKSLCTLVDLRYLAFYVNGPIGQGDPAECCVFQTDHKSSLERWCEWKITDGEPIALEKIYLLDLDKEQPRLNYTVGISIRE